MLVAGAALLVCGALRRGGVCRRGVAGVGLPWLSPLLRACGVDWESAIARERGECSQFGGRVFVGGEGVVAFVVLGWW